MSLFKIDEFSNCETEIDPLRNVDLNKKDIIHGVKIWDSDDKRFYDYVVKLVYGRDKIVSYLDVDGYKEEITSVEIPKEGYVLVGISDLDDLSVKMIQLGDMIFVMSTNDAVKIKNFYDAYDNTIDDVLSFKQNRIKEMYQSINGIDNFANNLVETIDDNKVLLNHDAVFIMQRIWSYDKFRKVSLNDEKSFDNESLMMKVVLMQTLIENMAEIIQEDNNISDDEAKYVCWEAIKEAAIIFYSRKWEEDYGLYLEEELQNAENNKTEGVLIRYMENVLKCNEISGDDYTMMAEFTYYLMYKGYTLEKKFFPSHFNLVVNAFEVIMQEMKKKSIKEKLKGNIKKEKMHYNINDIDMMNGNEFEHFICELFTKMGYKAVVTKQSGDQGLDVIAKRDSITIGIQAKCYSGTVGNSAIQEAVAGKSYYKCDKVIVITNNYFTTSAIELANANEVVLWNRDLLKEKLNELM